MTVHEVTPGELVTLGWDDRTAARFMDISRPGLVPGRVARVERSACVVALAAGEQVASSPPSVAVGDWVAIRVDGRDSEVVTIAERWSQLTRWDPAGRIQVLAANVDLVLITTPADRLSPARVERETAMAWGSGARPVVLVTKADLAGEAEVARLRARLGDVEVVATSAFTGDGLAAVGALLRPGRTAVLLGPSGAGKSSLANALIGSDRLATGAVREGDHRGRHTTTTRQLVAVPLGGVLIDTPGLRSLALTGDGAGVRAAFEDIEELTHRCRFRNCRHDREPGCAVLAAAAAGSLNRSRLASYLKLTGEAAVDNQRLEPRVPLGRPGVSTANHPTMRGKPKKR